MAYRLYAHSVCDTKVPLQLWYTASGAIQVLYAFAFALPSYFSDFGDPEIFLEFNAIG